MTTVSAHEHHWLSWQCSADSHNCFTHSPGRSCSPPNNIFTLCVSATFADLWLYPHLCLEYDHQSPKSRRFHLLIGRKGVYDVLPVHSSLNSTSFWMEPHHTACSGWRRSDFGNLTWRRFYVKEFFFGKWNSVGDVAKCKQAWHVSFKSNLCHKNNRWQGTISFHLDCSSKSYGTPILQNCLVYCVWGKLGITITHLIVFLIREQREYLENRSIRKFYLTFQALSNSTTTIPTLWRHLLNDISKLSATFGSFLTKESDFLLYITFLVRTNEQPVCV